LPSTVKKAIPAKRCAMVVFSNKKPAEKRVDGIDTD
jgi:hypothetical protein